VRAESPASIACSRGTPAYRLSARGQGRHTIHYHLSLSDPAPPSVSTIWRILKRRGFVTPQPHKRPKSSYIRFEAQLPNEMWQSDVTFFELRDGTKAEILNSSTTAALLV
jgi:transposase InsO family protein